MRAGLVKLGVILVLPLLMGQACGSPFGPTLGLGNRQPADGGIWRSQDQGVSWEQHSFVREEVNDDGESRAITLNSLDTNIMKMHPTDSRWLYISTDAGLYMTENGGDVWRRIRDGGMVWELTPDPHDSNTIYISEGSRIMKTTDAGGEWNEVYVEARGAQIQQIAVDILDQTHVYAGMNTGDVIVSTDGGTTWHLRTNVGGNIKKIVMSPYDSNVIFVATEKRGIVASFNRGQTWTELKEFYQEFNGTLTFRDLIYDETRNGSLLFASQYGLLWTNDSGRTWRPLNLVTPEGSVAISTLALNTNNPLEMYYTTGALLSRTFDGGANWNVQKLPTSRPPTTLLVDFHNPDTMYLSVRAPKKKNRFGG